MDSNIAQLTVAEALASLKSSPTGLSSAEAERRLAEFGPNKVIKITHAQWGRRILRDFAHFFAIILWISAALAFIAEWNDPGQGMDRVGYAIIIVIVVSGLFSFWQEYRVEQTLAALQRLLPQQVKAIRDARVVQLDVASLVPGDIIILEQGDNVPADCRVVEAYGIRVNNSNVTGESAPKTRDAEVAQNIDPLHAKNIILAGTSLVSGHGNMLVYSTGMHTEFGKIAQLTQTEGETISPLRKELVHLSRLIVFLALMIGLIFFIVGTVIHVPFWRNIIFTIGLIVAMVPEGLLPTLTLALVLAAQRMARRNVLIRHLPSVETLGSTTVICTDKTGTLTENIMRVERIAFGTSPAPLQVHEASALSQSHSDFYKALLLCHDIKESERDNRAVLLGDPMEIALVEMAQKTFPAVQMEQRLFELPFDSDRMRQTVVHAGQGGPMSFCKGAPESVLPLCTSAWDGRAMRTLDQNGRAAITDCQTAMAEQGLRVLAVASRPLPEQGYQEYCEQDLVFQGLVALEDPPRLEVPEALSKCHDAGIRVIMITGDHPRTALAIARKTGLVRSDSPMVITGEALRKLSSMQLQLALDTPEILFARVAAAQKMRIVVALKKKGHTVAVTGDGVNDAPALKAAHIGIAMGVCGTDVAKQAADMILLDDNFASIVNAVEEGRAIFDNIRKFLTYVLVHNVAELFPYLAYSLFTIPLPLTPIQILAVDMGTDTLTALGLGAEKPAPEVMQQPPRPANERLLDKKLALRAYLFLGFIEATTAMGAFFLSLHLGGWHYGEWLPMSAPLALHASSACLSAIIALQIVNVFLCRSSTRSLFTTGFGGNPLILWGVLLEAALLVLFIYTPWGNELLGTVPLQPAVWLLILPCALGMVLLEELRKLVARKLNTMNPPAGNLLI